MKISPHVYMDNDPIEYAYKQYEVYRKSAEKFNAFITLRKWEEIMEEVQRSSGKLKGLLIPVKDNISTKGIRTTCASRILSNYVPPYDAFVIDLLKREGGVIVGKTNMDEFAMGNTSETSYFGPVLNPWNTSHVPGGSSGGSGVSIAVGGIISLGSDTGGSVRQPAAYNYTLGLKPTYGLLSRYGLISYADSLEQIGIFARFSLDLALILYITSEYDYRDATMLNDHRRNSMRNNLKRIFTEDETHIEPEKHTIAYSTEVVNLAEERVVRNFYSTLEKLESEGFRIYEVDLNFMKAGLPAYYIIAMVEASSNLMRYDGIQYGKSELRGDYWSSTHLTRSKGFGDEVKRRIVLGTLLSSKGYEGKYYLRALRVRRWIRDSLLKLLEVYDYIALPTTPTPPPRFGEAVGPRGYVYDLYTVIPNLTGHPALSVPTGFVDGLPIGIQFITRWFNDDKLIKLSYFLENIIYDPEKVV